MEFLLEPHNTAGTVCKITLYPTELAVTLHSLVLLLDLQMETQGVQSFLEVVFLEVVYLFGEGGGDDLYNVCITFFNHSCLT